MDGLFFILRLIQDENTKKVHTTYKYVSALLVILSFVLSIYMHLYRFETDLCHKPARLLNNKMYSIQGNFLKSKRIRFENQSS